MFYSSEKQSCMGQTHAALKTGAKFKSVLLSTQLTQINNYQTEGLFVSSFVFLAPAALAELCYKPSFSLRCERSSCNSSWPPCPASWGGQPEHYPSCQKISLTATSLDHAPPVLWVHRGCGHIQTWGFGDILFLGRSWELEGIHCAAGTLRTAE